MPLAEEIQAALPKLNPVDNKDWTEGGAPSLTRIRALLKNDKVTQEQLDEVAGNHKRPDMTKAAPANLAEVHREPDKDKIEEAKKNHVIDETVVAIDRGYASGAVREPGEAFNFSGVMGSWMRKETAEEAKARLREVRDRVEENRRR